MQSNSFSFSLPLWISDYIDIDKHYNSVTERMALVIELSRLNVKNNTGGPFGAAIFDLRTNKLVAPGVNLVTTERSSVLHAEMVAMMLAQSNLQEYDLSSGNEVFELTTSTEPCAMCFGSIPWSGVKQLACAARAEDAIKVGFDEGPKLKNWSVPLEDRGITVIRDVLREEAAAILLSYSKNGGEIYNGRKGETLKDQAVSTR